MCLLSHPDTIAVEPSNTSDEAFRTAVDNFEKTERFERVPNSIPSRERFTEDRLDSGLASHIWFLAKEQGAHGALDAGFQGKTDEHPRWVSSALNAPPAAVPPPGRG